MMTPILVESKVNDPLMNKHVKMIPCKVEMAHYLYKGGLSIRKIAQIFKVTRGAIQFILFPDRKKYKPRPRPKHYKPRNGSKGAITSEQLKYREQLLSGSKKNGKVPEK